MTVPAGYFDGLSARRRAVIFSISDGIASVEGEDVSRREPVSALQIGDALGSAPRIIRFVDGAFCEVADSDGLQRLLSEHGLHRISVSQWETSGRWVAGAVLVFFALLFVAYRFAIPVFARVIAYRVPPAASEMISREVLEILDRQVLAPSGLPRERQEAIAGAFRRLQMPAGSGGASYRIHFRTSPLLDPNRCNDQ